MHKTGEDNNGYIFNTQRDRGEKASAILIRMTNDGFKIRLPTSGKGQGGHFYQPCYIPKNALVWETKFISQKKKKARDLHMQGFSCHKVEGPNQTFCFNTDSAIASELGWVRKSRHSDVYPLRWTQTNAKRLALSWKLLTNLIPCFDLVPLKKQMKGGKHERLTITCTFKWT